MTSGSWGCPHEHAGHCAKVDNRPCDPGMKGCVLAGRYVFFDAGKNGRLRGRPTDRTDPDTPTAPTS